MNTTPQDCTIPATTSDRFCDYIKTTFDAQHAIIAGIDALLDDGSLPIDSYRLVSGIRTVVQNEFRKVDARFMSHIDRQLGRK